MLKYLNGYPPDTTLQVEQIIQEQRLGEVLLKKYPHPHDVRTDNNFTNMRLN